MTVETPVKPYPTKQVPEAPPYPITSRPERHDRRCPATCQVGGQTIQCIKQRRHSPLFGPTEHVGRGHDDHDKPIIVSWTTK